MSDWIAWGDGTGLHRPERDKWYLVAIDSACEADIRADGNGYLPVTVALFNWHDEWEYYGDAVTHWMPLPAPPEERA